MKNPINFKKSLLAVTVLGALSGVAQAADSSVTMYGIIDAGIVSVSNQGNGSQSVTAANTGGLSPSIFGFKGSEDLGGGLKANFNLEGHFFSTTGAGNQWGGLFGRQANIGLSGDFGTVTVGKQYSPAVLAFAATDPRGLKETFSGLLSWALTQKTLNTGTNSNSVIDVFVANAISYGVKAGDFNIGASYSLGGVAGSSSANAVTALGVTYTGPVTISGAYQQDKGFQTAGSFDTTKYSIGGAYSFSDFTVTLNYLDNASTNAIGGAKVAHVDVIGAGLNYRSSANNTATVAFYGSKDKINSNANSKTWILSDDYALSKRTTIYGLLSGVNADANYAAVGGGSAFGVANNNLYLPTAGKNSTAVEFGIRHTF